MIISLRNSRSNRANSLELTTEETLWTLRSSNSSSRGCGRASNLKRNTVKNYDFYAESSRMNENLPLKKLVSLLESKQLEVEVKKGLR